MFKKIVLAVLVITGLLMLVPLFGGDPSFIPEGTVRGNSLTGWHVLGDATWKVQDGEITGTPKPGGNGGWLVLDRSYQDILFFTAFRCTGECKTGLLLRAEKTPQGMKGVYAEFDDPAIPSFRVTLDEQGKELTRERLRNGGGQQRIMAPFDPNAAARGGGARGGAAGAGRGGATGAPGAPGAPAGAARGGGGRGAAPNVTLPYTRPPNAFRENGEWNRIEIDLDANILRPFLNDALGIGGSPDDADGKYGPIALYVGGSGEVHFKQVGWKDVNLKTYPVDKVSPNFRMQRLSDFYYSYGAAAGDFNHDGIMDVVSGPHIYYGPDFRKSKEIYLAHTFNPSDTYSNNCWMQYAADFTGDGWPDVINANFDGDRGVWLYVNPKGESRRWDKYLVIPNFSSEIAVLRDVDGDGKPEFVYTGDGTVRYAKPDPANPTGTWIVKDVSERGYGVGHGIGVGDINGDGRMDIINTYGWWEQPPAGSTQATWTYHPEAFGRYGRQLWGGSVMGAWDVNGDGLTDVITVLNAHGYGLAWFEQKRDASGKISFVRHMIMDDFSTKNAGGVTFTEPHGSAVGDIDGDGIPDFVVGKRYWAHRDDLLDPDPYGEPVLYAYLTRRNPKAEGGGEFIPELIHNHSGAGSDVLVTDLNKDGVMDVVTATRFGTFIFFGKPRPGAVKVAPTAVKK